jgi:hypothetical protein
MSSFALSSQIGSAPFLPTAKPNEADWVIGKERDRPRDNIAALVAAVFVGPELSPQLDAVLRGRKRKAPGSFPPGALTRHP